MLLCNNDLIKRKLDYEKSRVNNHINMLIIYTAYIFIPERPNPVGFSAVILIVGSITAAFNLTV